MTWNCVDKPEYKKIGISTHAYEYVYVYTYIERLNNLTMIVLRKGRACEIFLGIRVFLYEIRMLVL